MKKLSIIVPIFNEEKTLPKILNKISKQKTPGFKKEVILVNDGSTDNSLKVINSHKTKIKSVKVVSYKLNRGKGGAVRGAVPYVFGDFVLIQDADLEYDPNEWGKLLKKARENVVVFGSRNINPKRRGYSHYILGVFILTKICNLLYGSSLTDIYTCFKLIPAKVFKELRLASNGFEFESEVTAKLLRSGIPIKEVAIIYNPRTFKEGKKIKISDGFKGLWTLLKIKFN